MIDARIPGLRILSIPLWLLAWLAIASAGLLSPKILPDPRIVAVALYGDIASGLLVNSALISAGRALTGFALAIPCGVVLGALIARVRIIDALFEPITFITYPIPKIALFPVLTFAFGLGSPSKIAFAFLESFYPIVAASIFAFRGTRIKLIWTAQAMGASATRILTSVMIPAALPGIFTGLRVGLPVSLLVVIVAEMIGDSRGLGFYISNAMLTFRMEKVFVGIIAVGALGFVFDRLLILVGRFFVPRRAV